MELVEALRAHLRKVITFTGAGGKTTLMYRLARELSSSGRTVVVTTTTKIWPPGDDQTDRLLIARTPEKIYAALYASLGTECVVTLATALTEDGKLKGISPECVAKLRALDGVDHVLVEGDGSAQKPLTAPLAHEPVIPDCTDLVVSVVGVDALGRSLGAANVHRPEVIAELTGLASGDAITPEAIAAVMIGERGNVKGKPPGCKVIPVINKADNAKAIEHARKIARCLVDGGAYRIVIAAGAQSDPVREVISGSRLTVIEPWSEKRLRG
ncbi:MAG: putative selenium-dependent hydroxylase accessory protein YqeC [Chloroflexota bacterium]|nr:MAG: putative selenium-dependent hydroxylase accessory protein YqeC [Chloroflexota bacterium]